jgi:hypothetical protein
LVGYHELSGKGVGVEEAKADPKVSWKRIGKFYQWFFASIINLIVVLAMVLAVADVIHWHNVRRDFFGGAEMKVFPKPIPDTSLVVAQGTTTLTQSGCTIDLPWPNVVVVQERYALLPDHRSVSFEDPARATDEASIFREVFHDSTFRSNYDLLSAQLNFDPSELTTLPWGRKHERQLVFAAAKATTIMTHKQTPIYTVTLGNVRGFQYGDAKQTSELIEIKMFDPNDRQFRLNIVSGNPDVPWTQAEINFIIHSMRCDDATYSAARHAWDSKFHGHQ